MVDDKMADDRMADDRMVDDTKLGHLRPSQIIAGNEPSPVSCLYT